MNSPHSIHVVLATLGILATTSAEVVTWDGEGPDDLWTTGLNWYWNPYARMQFNYIRGGVTRGPDGGDYDIIGVRMMVISRPFD